jgi:galactokinase
MTGGGFGGCIIALVPDDMVDNVISLVEKNYQQQTGLKESIYISRPVKGVSIVNGE